MTKLVYPVEGLYKQTSTFLDSSISLLGNACNEGKVSCPSDFAYRTYVTSLYSKLSSYKKDMTSIRDDIQKISLNYENLEVELNNKAKVLGNYKAKKRERSILND